MKCIIICLLIVIINTYYIRSDNYTNKTLMNFAFGSCFNKLPKFKKWNHTIFKTVLANNPDLWLWMGDSAYVDNTTVVKYHKHTLDLNFTLIGEKFNTTKNDECKIF